MKYISFKESYIKSIQFSQFSEKQKEVVQNYYSVAEQQNSVFFLIPYVYIV